MAEMGLTSGARLAPFDQQWDPRPDFRPEDGADLGEIGENAKGVWASVHPLTQLSEHPRIWDIVTEFQAGIREVTRPDLLALSNLELEGKVVMLAAQQREEGRRAQPDKGDEE